MFLLPKRSTYIAPCPFCNSEGVIRCVGGRLYINPYHTKRCVAKPDTWLYADYPIWQQIRMWNKSVEKTKEGVLK